MRAAVYREKGRLAVEERPVPEPGPQDVLLRVSHCGVCGSDLHLVMEGWGRPDSIGGHEFSGRVAVLGAGVTGWELGAAVVGGPPAGCGHCEYCATHRPSLCARHGTPGVSEFQGAFAEYVRVHESQLRRIPAGLSLREAALAEPLAVALHGVTLSQIAPGRRALVTGAGPIGMLTLAALRAKGIDDVTVSEPSAARRAAAASRGRRA
jgi:threonine dehydrogenase-like Zn-dependent dehydrogenase